MTRDRECQEEYIILLTNVQKMPFTGIFFISL
jgi:hypothetical protein